MANATAKQIMDVNLQVAFEKYFAGCQAIYDAYHARMGYSENNHTTHKYTIGRRYIKVIAVSNQESVHSFVDMTNGNVLKPAGWSAPAKHARGNIYDDQNGLGMMGEYGPKYLR